MQSKTKQKSCAILTMDNTENFVIYDDLLKEPLKLAHWDFEFIPWRKSCDWNRFDVVIIRSPWDYQDAPQEFLNVLETIDQSSAQLENSLKTVKWNIDKKYLKALARKGIKTIPTLWQEEFNLEALLSAFDRFNTEELVIKPCISANADDTFRLAKTSLNNHLTQLERIFNMRSHMIQPMIRAIVEEGEYSLFYFNGQYSHGILKTPQKGDFRVQEEHGGTLQCVEPCDKLLRASTDVLEQIDDTPLYARFDFVKEKGDFLLIEAELIEPSLYFNLDPKSPARFVEALETKIFGDK